MRLSVERLYALVTRHGAEPFLDRIMVAAALTESDGDTKAVGDNGHSCGLWQLHDQGLGLGMTKEERFDPDLACARMLPEFRRVYTRWKDADRVGADLAVRTYLWTERPRDYQNMESDAALNFLRRWPETLQSDEPLIMAVLARLLPNPHLDEQRANWAVLRQNAGQNPNDWEAFRRFEIAIGAPDPGDEIPLDFPIGGSQARGLSLAMLSESLPNPNLIDQARTWQALRRAAGQDHNDWSAFRQFQLAIGALDPGPQEPGDFRTR